MGRPGFQQALAAMALEQTRSPARLVLQVGHCRERELGATSGGSDGRAGRSLGLEHLSQRRRFLAQLGSISTSPFWQRFTTLPTPLERLRALSGLSRRERREAVLAVAELLEDRLTKCGWSGGLLPGACLLHTAYPFGSHPELVEYFRLYRSGVRSFSTAVEMAEAAQNKTLWNFPTEQCRGCGIGSCADRVAGRSGIGWAGLISDCCGEKGIRCRSTCRANLPSATIAPVGRTTATAARYG